MKTFKSWIKASRLTSQSYIFLPILAGQMFHVMTGGSIDWVIFTILHLYGLFMQLYIVYANDFADVETDQLNQTFTIFSGGSRVLVDGDLERGSIGTAAVIMAVLSVACGLVLAYMGRVWAPAIIVAGIALLWMYSFSPVRLSYRGGGEFLQMLGVGVVLPLMGYYGQSGNIVHFPVEAFVIILPTQLACAMATSLPDFRSDLQSQKLTSTVLMGQTGVRWAIIVLNLLSIAAFVLIEWVHIQDFAHVWPLLALVAANLALLLWLHPNPNQGQVTLFVLFSIIVTTGLMGFVAYVAAHPGLAA